MKTLVTFCGLLLVSGLSMQASSILEEGFADLRAGNAETAIKTWTRNTSDPALLDKARWSGLIDQQKKLGANLDYEIRSKSDLGSGSCLYLVSARFEKGTLFFRIMVFTNNLNQTSINLLRWSTDPSDVWPDRVLFPDKKY